MNIVILNGSARANSNSVAFSKSFAEGAISKGHSVETFQIGRMKINGCVACEGCHSTNKGCVQKDDMQAIYPALKNADMIVIASPVHYWGFSGQLQSLLTRLYALPGMKPPKARLYALILSSGSQGVYDGIISQYNNMVKYFGAKSAGIMTFSGECDQRSEENLKKMFDFGASI